VVMLVVMAEMLVVMAVMLVVMAMCWWRWWCAGGDVGGFLIELGAKFIEGPILPRVGIPRVRPDKLYFYS